MPSKDIRHLLLDCRAALRRAEGFERSPLGERLDRTLIGLRETAIQEREDAREQEQSAMTQRVAYAWQGVARELRRTHPDLYEQLSAKVLQRLGATAPGDAQEEIETLRAELRQREAALAATAAELDALRNVLAAAVPLADATGRSESELAHERVQALLEAVAKGGGVAPASTPPGDPAIPTRDRLLAVAEGRRPLTPTEREWCIGEALVLTGFQQTPVQLLADGDAGLARCVLSGTALHA